MENEVVEEAQEGKEEDLNINDEEYNNI